MKNKYYCGKCEHIGMYTGSYTHSEKLCKRYAAILKVDGNDVEKCVPCICETLEAENVALRNEADENAALSMENKMRADRLEKENAALRGRLENVVELPCEVGSTVYSISETDEEDNFNPWIDAGRVVSFSIDVILWIYVRYNSGLTMWYTKDSFDEKVYITLEEAEARLAELKGGAK